MEPDAVDFDRPTACRMSSLGSTRAGADPCRGGDSGDHRPGGQRHAGPGCNELFDLDHGTGVACSAEIAYVALQQNLAYMAYIGVAVRLP